MLVTLVGKGCCPNPQGKRLRGNASGKVSGEGSRGWLVRLEKFVVKLLAGGSVEVDARKHVHFGRP